MTNKNSDTATKNGQVVEVFNIGTKDMKLYANSINYCGASYNSSSGMPLASGRGCRCIFYSTTWYVHQYIES